MKLWQICASVFAVTALAAHFFVLNSLPDRIMSAARTALIERGAEPYVWSASPRMTPQRQTIVRPSPDLAYSICLFDTADGPIQLSAPGWDGYGSLSVFDAKTNNVFVTSLNVADAAARGVIVATRDNLETILLEVGETPVIEMDGEGLALIRRLAASPEQFESAQTLVSEAVCQRLSEN